jgi:hypothetical protein
VKCPACNGTAIIKGNAFGKEVVTDEGGDILVRQAISPTLFSCAACQLKLEGYAELEVCDLIDIFPADIRWVDLKNSLLPAA